MAKIKERKSESWKPPIQQDDGFISKNKKRKDKRFSLNLAAKKIGTEEFIPVKKSPFGAPNKSKGAGNGYDALAPAKNLSFNSPNKGNRSAKKDSLLSARFSKQDKPTPGSKRNSLLLTSKPTPNTKKHSLPPAVLSKQDKGTPKSELKQTPSGKKNTAPNNLFGHATKNSGLKRKNVEELINCEAIEGEEPIEDKVVKPYLKSSEKKKFAKKIQEESDQESDDESDSDEDITSGQAFLDNEASEGEETDEEDSDEGEEDSDDDFLDSDVDDEEVSADEDDSEEGTDGDESEDDDDEEEGGLDLEEIPALPNDGNDNEDEDSDDDSDSEEDITPVLSKSNLTNKKNLKEQQKLKPEAQAKIAPEKGKKDAKVKAEVKSEKTKGEKVGAAPKPETKIEKSEEKPSDYAGFVNNVPKGTTEEQIKEVISGKLNSKNILSIVLKKRKRKPTFLIYVKDEDALDKIVRQKFSLGSVTFMVHRARENKTVLTDKPVAFFPRVSVTITDEILEGLVEKDVGAGKILKVRSKPVFEKYQSRNVLIELADIESLKKLVFKGGYDYKGTPIVVREAFESGSKIPVYKIVLGKIPEQTSEALIKKAVESVVGKGSVHSVKFSFQKKSFAFVIMNSEEAQKKALEPDTKVSVKGTELVVNPYRPKKPKKRSVQNAQSKKRKSKTPSTEESPKLKKTKKEGVENGVAKTKKSKKPGANVKQENKENSPAKVKENGKASQKKKQKLPQASDNKKSPQASSSKKEALVSKIEAKKHKLKNKKVNKKGKVAS